ncbi:acyltransferase [Vibrio cholerae]
MLATHLNTFKLWLRDGDSPSKQRAFQTLKAIRACDLPFPTALCRLMYHAHRTVSLTVQTLLRTLWHTPIFKGRVNQCGKRLYLYGGVPYVSGALEIHIADDARISGHTTFSARPQSQRPTLVVGSNTDIGWQTTIAVGSRVIIDDHVRIAGRAFLFGYSGHSLDPKLRALGEGDLDKDVGDIILERDVWLGTNVTVCPGVTIGQGTVVAAGSVVTKSLPAFVVAAGNPAKVVKTLPFSDNSFSDKTSSEEKE